MQENIRVSVVVLGDVHGVNFRTNTAQRARALELRGWVKNTSQGVEAVFEGRGEAIEKITEWIKRGPRGAVVTGYDVREEPYRGEFKNFEIRYE